VDINNVTDEEMLDRWLVSQESIDVNNAAKVLKEVKQILDSFGITFFLRQGTCLGAIRDNAFIPWDDDIDVGSIMGLHGVSKESLEQVVAAFRNNGFLTQIKYLGENPYLPLVKSSIRCDWTCFSIIDDYIVQFPFLKTPINLFTQLKEITFIGEKFCVPNPPEEYLRLKYGDDWGTPHRPGHFEADVLNQAIKSPAPSSVGRLRQLFAGRIPGQRPSRIKVLDQMGRPVSGAEVTAIGLGQFKTDKQGYARFHVPRADNHPIIVRFENHEEIHYLPIIKPGETYICQPNQKLRAVTDTDTA
jgi:hypothetical protein